MAKPKTRAPAPKIPTSKSIRLVFGERLKLAMLAAGRIPRMLAAETDTSCQTVRSHMHGEQAPSLVTMTLYAIALGVSVGYLAGEDVVVAPAPPACGNGPQIPAKASLSIQPTHNPYTHRVNTTPWPKQHNPLPMS